MGGFIFDQGNLNLAGLTTPGGYVQLIPPTGPSLPGVSSAVALAGTGIWGPVNQLQGPFGEISSYNEANGQFKADAYLLDPYDMGRAAMQILEQAQTENALHLYTNRISDGTDAAASITLKDVTPTTALNGMTIPAKWTGTGGNTIKILIAAAGPANLYNVTVIASFAGAVRSEIFLNIPGSASGASPFWANFAAAIANGNDSRGPSDLLGTPTGVSGSALNPAVGTFTLTGGTDGRSGVTSATFFGSDVIGNRQGIYAFRGMPIVPSYVYCAGMADQTKVANLLAFTMQEIVRYVFPLPAGTSASAAVTARNTLGVSDKRFCYAKDWIYWSDPISGKLLFTDPVAVMIGRAASLSPQLSPLNKPVYGVVKTEHERPYPADEIGLMNSNGIWVICNPCLQQPFMGIASASTTSLNALEQPVEYERLKDYIGIHFASVLSRFVGLPQGTYDPDDTREKCKAQIDGDMRLMWEAGLIVDWESQCDEKNNSPQSVAAGFMKGKLKYLPFFTVKFALLDLATDIKLSNGQALALAQANGQGG